ncbi:hypothetical protein D3C76_992100 [compost metagenome]
MDLVQATGVEQFDHPPGLGRDVIAAAGLEAGFAMAGQIGHHHPVVADKMPGKAQPEILVGAVAMQHQDAAGRFIGPTLPGRYGHLADGDGDLVQPVETCLQRHAHVVQHMADAWIRQPTPGDKHGKDYPQHQHVLPSMGQDRM